MVSSIMDSEKQVSNDEWLQFLHQLHNEIRGASGIKLTGLPALNEINNLLVLFFAEPHIVREMKNDSRLTEFCRFTYLHDRYASDARIEEDKKCFTKERINKPLNRDLLWRTIYQIDQKNEENYCVLQRIACNEYLSRYIYDDVLKMSIYSIKSEVAPTIQKIINMMFKRLNGVKFTHDFYDAFGSAYERFKTDYVGNSGKNTGQHFTPTSIKQFIINELKPTSNELFYEPCAGSGGFIHTAYSYVFKHDIENSEKFKDNIYANECNPEIIKPLKINMMLHDIHTENIKEMDSLSCDNCKEYLEKFDLIATNPPFGMKTTLDPTSYVDIDKDNYWRCLVRKKNVIKDSSGQFVVHIFNTLKKNGRCGFVIDRGVLCNGDDDKSWQVQLRKFLFENANVYKIVMLPTGIFDYTNFATAIVFFKKGEKTETLRIYRGMFENESKKEGLKIDVQNPEQLLTIDELRENGYSLKNAIVSIVNYNDLITLPLQEVITITRGKSCTIENMINGTYRVIGGGYVPMDGITHNEFNADENTILMSNDGAYAGYINMFNEKMFITSHCNKVSIKNDDFEKKYVYYFMKFRERVYIKREEDGGYKKGQGTPNINIDKLLTVEVIPHIDKDSQKKVIDIIDTVIPTRENLHDIVKSIGDYPIFNLLIEHKFDLFESIIHIINRKLELKSMIEKFEEDKKAVFNIMLSGMKCEEKFIENICTIHAGTHLDQDTRMEGIYPVYGGGDILMYINKYNREDEIIVSRMGVSLDCIRYEKNKFYLTEHGWTLECKPIINKKFLYTYLRVNMSKVYAITTGSAQKGISQKNFNGFSVKIPSIEDQQKIITEMTNINAQCIVYRNHIDELDRVLKALIEKE